MEVKRFTGGEIGKRMPCAETHIDVRQFAVSNNLAQVDVPDNGEWVKR